MKKLSVLFVDDEEKVLKGLRRNLRRVQDRWDMSFALNGFDGLALLGSKSFDVVVSDMMMPEMSGEEFLSRVLKEFPGVARIVLSGHCDQATAFRLIGSDHFYLSKPCPLELLIETVETVAALPRSLQTASTPPPAPEAVNAEDVRAALCDWVQLLLMRGEMEMASIPESIKCWLPDSVLSTFAPVIGHHDDFLKSTRFDHETDWDEYFDKNE